MGLRLYLASMWLPNFVLKAELDRVSAETTEALCLLLNKFEPVVLQRVSTEIRALSGSLKERREIMAYNHSLLVNVLADEITRDRAVMESREVLYRVGLRFGEESRRRLGVGETIDDLFSAARLLYRVLGIRFTISGGSREYQIMVHRCALSMHYSELTCAVLSAVDEGVVNGLNPLASMRFDRMITKGYPTCHACVRIESGGS